VISRRAFLRAAGVSAASAAARLRASGHHAAGQTSTLDVGRLARFVDPLPIPATVSLHVPAGSSRASAYRIAMRQVEARVHRDLPPTRFWSFGDTFPGPTISVRRGQPVWIEWANELPSKHPFAIDHTLHGAERGLSESRAVVHVHGAKAPPESDGYPDHWMVPGKSTRCLYPNDQDAATLWYHDHTMGINRLNVFAGLMGVYLIHDDVEDALRLPSGPQDIPLLICDRFLDAHAQLNYPASDDPDAPWVPEVFGDAMLVNGALSPYLAVERRRYRLRVVNGSNARFLHLALSSGEPFQQIASDLGLLEAPASTPLLQLAPAERADVVVDFANHGGQELTLMNGGQPILQFRVGTNVVDSDRPLPERLRTIERLKEADAIETRTHTLGEDDDLVARPMRMLLNNTRWHAPVTEKPLLDSTEVWNLANVTDDSHPIHLHLARFQILERRPFDVYTYLTQRRVVYTGAPVPPSAGERGWKDTVRADPAMMTRIIARFEGFPGRYMWHCHILEHADNEMMRPMDVVAPPSKTAARAKPGE